MKKNILLIISFILLLSAVGIFFYLKNQNTILDKEINDLKDNIVKVNEKINNSKDEKVEKENEYEKLKEELKGKIEELEIWKETEEKLNTALSS